MNSLIFVNQLFYRYHKTEIGKRIMFHYLQTLHHHHFRSQIEDEGISIDLIRGISVLCKKDLSIVVCDVHLSTFLNLFNGFIIRLLNRKLKKILNFIATT